MMNKYECLFIIDPELGEENIQALVEKFKNLLETSAQLENIDEWGKESSLMRLQTGTRAIMFLLISVRNPISA